MLFLIVVAQGAEGRTTRDGRAARCGDHTSDGGGCALPAPNSTVSLTKKGTDMHYATTFRTAISAIIFLFCCTVMSASEWSSGGLAQAQDVDIAAQNDGSYILATTYPQETPNIPEKQVQFVRYTPSTRQFEAVLAISTTGSVAAISHNGNVALYHSGKFSILRLSDSMILDAFAFGSMTDFYETSCFSADGNSLIVIYSNPNMGSYYQYECLHRDITTGTSESFLLNKSGFLTTNSPKFSFSPDGSMVAAFIRTTTHSLELWNTTTGDHTVVPIPESDPTDSSLVINHTYAVFTEKNSTPTLVNLATGTTATLGSKLRYEPRELADDNTLTSSVYTRTFSPYGMLGSNILVQNVENHDTLGLFPYSLRSSETISAVRAGTTVGLAIMRTSICPTGTDWLSIPQIGAMFYDIPQSRLIGIYPDNGHTNGITSTALSPDGRLVASTGNDMQTLWRDTETGALVGSAPNAGYVAFANETMLLRGSGLFIDEIDLKTQSVSRRKEITSDFITGLEMSHSGTTIAASTPFTISLLSYPDLEVKHTLISPSEMHPLLVSMRVTTTGTLVAAFTATPSSFVSTAVIAQWDATTGVLISSTIATISRTISSIELSPDGQTAVLWDANGNILRGHFFSTDGSPIRDIRFGDDNSNRGYFDSEFSPDGSSLYVVNREWYLEQGQLGLRQVIRRLAVRDSVAEVLGFSATAGKAFGLHILPDNSAAVIGYPTFEGAECSAGILESVELRPRPVALLSTSSLDFGEVFSGTTEQRSVTLTTGNDIPLIVQNISISNNMAYYGLTAYYNYPLPDTIQPGEERTIVFTLAPDYPNTAPVQGSMGSAFVGFANTYVAEEAISMTATTVGPKITSDIMEITFGDVEVGSTERRTVLLLPDNLATLNISDIFLYGELSDEEQFSLEIDKTLPAALQEGDRIAVTLSFTPSRIGTPELELVARSNDHTQPEMFVPVRARGVMTTDIVGQLSRQQTTRISPQPASSILTISFETAAPGTASIELFSTEGRLAAAKYGLELGAGTHTTTLSVEHVPAGVYVCRIKTPAGTITKPVVISP